MNIDIEGAQTASSAGRSAPKTHPKTHPETHPAPEAGLSGCAFLLGQDFGEITKTYTATLAQFATCDLTQAIPDDGHETAPQAGRLFGVFPFDRTDQGHLYRLSPKATPAQVAADEAVSHSLTRLPETQGFGASVDAVAQKINAGDGGLKKVVLARSLVYDTDAPIDPVQVALRLSADRHVTSYCVPLPGESAAPRWLVGATPELLLSKQGAAIRSHPLAGSARRQSDASADAAVGQALLTSEKDNIEHRVVVEYIHDVLTPYCRSLKVPDQPQLDRTATMWHLGTAISGVLKEADTPVLALLRDLHPTPAVAGFPLAAALAQIDAQEPFARDFYAGTLGWLDGDNNGAWHVTLRCAVIAQHSAQLFAGAGIVGASKAADEIAETRAKFGAMRLALGICERL
ncbi:isochorismate synthase [Aquimixticola soesokkakensis]|uniref:isochorismate synthase n=1 Tax=Aquimixticola soesokkakensis TaxID=1519096 RepID=UPI00135650B0|nr:isochorismate synthase [Aquimixticola soesokkakensis]